jgi:hypothetical protein
VIVLAWLNTTGDPLWKDSRDDTGDTFPLFLTHTRNHQSKKVIVMTKFYMKWKMNPMTVPADPGERVKYWLLLLEEVRAQLKSGELIDWGIACDSSEGYCFAETDEKKPACHGREVAPLYPVRYQAGGLGRSGHYQYTEGCSSGKEVNNIQINL